ncbi:cupin domain-containing protein [Microscilla marina]|uniref:Cupin domain protein n=1 Tax=Microscilla marina ATCC 23134 TaxID=313606 RepID=A1ZHA7_MICM2|nr:cupin domain-containing protein [Microscilla marina]EAY30376.1 cupin domain protein [Microscilla marina ATCC 23134]
MKKTKQNSEHYSWGNQCEGWHLVKDQSLSVIQEIMAPYTKEERHFHAVSQQLFFILKGQATFELDGKVIKLTQGESLHIKPRQKHQIQNNTDETLEFLVVSQPTTRGDRMEEVAEE